MNASWTRIHSLGHVVLGDDVEMGANSCIDKGTIRATTVGNRTKIDNLVHLGHNVTAGEDCLFCALVGIAGSTQVGDRVVLGGQVGVTDNIFIGDDVVAGGGSQNPVESARGQGGSGLSRNENGSVHFSQPELAAPAAGHGGCAQSEEKRFQKTTQMTKYPPRAGGREA